MSDEAGAEASVREAEDSRLGRFARRFGKFSVVGVGNAVVDVGVLNLLIWMYAGQGAMQLAAFNLAAIILANANSYVWNTLWTFRDKAEGDARQRTLFSLQALANVGVNAGAFWVCATVIFAYTSLSPTVGGNLAKAVSVAVAFAVSFLLLRHLVFAKKEGGDED
ncbi:MAG: GtrA family protein [Rubrobacter sp.]|nr:GtrA family protein [Rubrobacter sp.]